MLKLRAVHHIALICSDYARSKAFYTEILGFRVLAEHYRPERDSWKLELAFAVSALDEAVATLETLGIACEPIRTDPYTQRRFTFFADPDQLPLELYEQ